MTKILLQFGSEIWNIFSLFVEKEGKSGLNKGSRPSPKPSYSSPAVTSPARPVS